MWRKSRARWWIASCVVASILILALQAIQPWIQVLIRDDESWPHHRFFLLRKGISPERGSLVAFTMTDTYADRVKPGGMPRPYARVGLLWLKRVVGMPGDRVDVVEDVVRVNGEEVAKGLKRDRLGQDIEVVSLESPIPNDAVFVALPYPRSFDSRYFGYVNMKDIIGEVYPLW
ncbi:MAG: hypothetical protein NPIRA01_34200 [Nitrospirales bacterium]|nr:MAG: hypothetical protein NPIRA01_34200 [Nitrospirales bacterium]